MSFSFFIFMFISFFLTDSSPPKVICCVNYRAATQEDLDKQRSLKLKNSNEHKLFMCQHGIMKEYSKKEGKYIQSTISADYELFCVLVF